MQCFQGKSVYKGIAMGPVVVLRKNDYQVKTYQNRRRRGRSSTCGRGTEGFSGAASETLRQSG